MRALPAHWIDANGLADGQYALDVVGGGVTGLVAGTGGGASELDDLSDVDTSTTPPSSGQTLLFDGSLWKPGTITGGGGSGSVGVGPVLPDPATVPDQLFILKQAGGGSQNYINAALSDNPWAFWEQVETSGTTLADSSGTNDLTITGTPGLAQIGPDGNNDAVAWPASTPTAPCYANTSTSFPAGSATFEAWVKLTQLPSALTSVFSLVNNQGDSQGSAFLAIDTAGKLAVYAGSGNLTRSTNSLTLGEWHHVALIISAAGQVVRADNATVVSNNTYTSVGSWKIFINGGLHSGFGTPDFRSSGPFSIAYPAAYPAALATSRLDAHHDALATPPPELWFSDGNQWWKFGVGVAT